MSIKDPPSPTSLASSHNVLYLSLDSAVTMRIPRNADYDCDCDYYGRKVSDAMICDYDGCKVSDTVIYRGL